MTTKTAVSHHFVLRLIVDYSGVSFIPAHGYQETIYLILIQIKLLVQTLLNISQEALELKTVKPA